MTPRVTLSASFYPHLIDMIFAHADRESLKTLRTVCKSWNERATSILARHILMRYCFGILNEPLGVVFEMADNSGGHEAGVPGLVQELDEDGCGWDYTPRGQARFSAVLSHVRILDVDIPPISNFGLERLAVKDAYAQFRALTNVDTLRHHDIHTYEDVWAWPVRSRRVVMLTRIGLSWRERWPDSEIPTGPLQHGVEKLVVTMNDHSGPFTGGFGIAPSSWPTSLREVVFIYLPHTDRVSHDWTNIYQPHNGKVLYDRANVNVTRLFDSIIHQIALSIPQIKFTFVGMDDMYTRFACDASVADTPIKTRLTNDILERAGAAEDDEQMRAVIAESLTFCSAQAYRHAIGEDEFEIETDIMW